MPTRRPLTYADHEQLGELLDEARARLLAAWDLAVQAYPVKELAALEWLWRTDSPIDGVKRRLDDHLYQEAQAGTLSVPHGAQLSQVYYHVHRLLSRTHPGAEAALEKEPFYGQRA